jgi:VanZ family protein
MKRLTILFILFLIGVVLVADAGLGPKLFVFLDHIPGGDKTGHLALMGTLSFLVNRSLSAARTRVLSVRVLKGSLIVAVIVTLEEFSQLFLHNRGFSLVDLAADYVGIILFGQLAAYVTKRVALVSDKEGYTNNR